MFRKWTLFLAAGLLIIAMPGSAQMWESVASRDIEYGTCIATGPFAAESENNPDSITYRNKIRELFSWGVTENCLKMGYLRPSEDVYNFETADNILDWCEGNKIHLKGHALVWGTRNHVPEWIDDYLIMQRDDILKEHIQTVVEHFAGRITVWDVVNEPVHVDGWEEALQWETVDLCEKALIWAHEADPDAELYINDYNLLGSAIDRRNFVNLINELVDRNAPIDGIGVQGHFGPRLPSIEELERAMLDLTEPGLPIDITEFDMRPPENPDQPYTVEDVEYDTWWDYQAEAYRMMFEFFDQQPAINRVFMWGFTDRHHWRTGAGILDENYDLKPAGEIIVPILLGEIDAGDTGDEEIEPIEEEIRGFYY